MSTPPSRTSGIALALINAHAFEAGTQHLLNGETVTRWHIPDSAFDDLQDEIEKALIAERDGRN